jgi:hypothetical protein
MRDLHVSYTLCSGGDWNTLKTATRFIYERLINERFPSVMGERVIVTLKVRRLCLKTSSIPNI